MEKTKRVQVRAKVQVETRREGTKGVVEEVVASLSKDSRKQVVVASTLEHFDNLQATMKEYEPTLTTGMRYGNQSKYLRWVMPSDETIELLHVTDVQFGHRECKYDRVVEYRDWVLAEPNRYMLWGGDNVDAYVIGGKGSPYDQIGDPQSQVYKFCEVWAPARHRVLGYVGGNHERRSVPGFGDLGTLIATILGVPYSDGKQIIDITFGAHQPFKISMWHGAGGARTKGTVAQILHRFMGQGDSQLYLIGHLHQAMVIPDWKEYRDRGRVKLQKCIGAIGTSFLNTWGTYGEVAGYSTHDVLMARTVLEPNGKWEVTLR